MRRIEADAEEEEEDGGGGVRALVGGAEEMDDDDEDETSFCGARDAAMRGAWREGAPSGISSRSVLTFMLYLPMIGGEAGRLNTRRRGSESTLTRGRGRRFVGTNAIRVKTRNL